MNIVNSFLELQSQQTITYIGVVIFLCIVFVIAGNYINKQDPFKKNGKFMTIIEIYYDMMSGLVDQMFKGRAGILKPYCTMLILLLLTCNWLPLLLPLDAPTTDYNIPLALVLITFAFKYVYEFKFNGAKSMVKGYFEPVPVMLPLNLMDIVAKPLSMSMRIFGNLLSGTLIMMVFMTATAWLQNQIFVFGPLDADGLPLLNIIGGVVSPPLHFYFDVFAGAIQAFVFTLLTLVFTSLELDFDAMNQKSGGK
ncbi:F0F1 ATP synthase subunit A [Mycoplasma sp. P36-A1]|uniref:F0F1 ATP synthase subunit A n=1 Tax=Mycoplasma sp. P36-A1 TaxID=3252900 RepID=UPI003C2C717A